jgi:DNA-binding transcriptional MerR regulator
VLTIGQLAAYAGVTPRTVRHYHQVGLLPEPERDASGYRSYDAPAVVRLIRIRTLAESGVPLARVQQLLDADEQEFAAAVAVIDARLRGEVQVLQQNRRRIAKLAAGDSLALPPEATDYLDRMRMLGVPELLVEIERDAWILIAARWPEKIPEFMAVKMALLDEPRLLRMYRVLGEAFTGDGDPEELLVEAADLLAELAEEAGAEHGQDEQLADRSFVDLLDTLVLGAGPRAVRLRDRLQELMVERGWRGLATLERVDERRAGSPTA